MPRAQAEARMAAAGDPAEQRLAVADIVIDNSGSLGDPGQAGHRNLGRGLREQASRPVARAARPLECQCPAVELT